MLQIANATFHLSGPFAKFAWKIEFGAVLVCICIENRKRKEKNCQREPAGQIQPSRPTPASSRPTACGRAPRRARPPSGAGGRVAAMHRRARHAPGRSAITCPQRRASPPPSLARSHSPALSRSAARNSGGKQRRRAAIAAAAGARLARATAASTWPRPAPPRLAASAARADGRR